MRARGRLSPSPSPAPTFPRRPRRRVRVPHTARRPPVRSGAHSRPPRPPSAGRNSRPAGALADGRPPGGAPVRTLSVGPARGAAGFPPDARGPGSAGNAHLPDAMLPPILAPLPTASPPFAPAAAPPRAALRGRLLRRLLGIAPVEATFARRGFAPARAPARRRLERVGFTFLDGYHAALEAGGGGELAARLEGVEPALRGFAYEGAAMALALLDALTPWRRGRVAAFLRGAGEPHAYMVYVGAGWALARLRRPLHGVPRGMDPLLGWLAADGYGFHEGYFHPGRFAGGRALPRRVSGYALRAFDQGLGRSLWFAHGADPARIAAAIARFAPGRRGDLWSGAGLACAYAGGAGRGEAEALAGASGPHRPALAQGAAFAAGARRRAGNPAPHTELACRALCGAGADAAAAVTEAALDGLAPRAGLPAYEVWRLRIQRHFAGEDRA